MGDLHRISEDGKAIKEGNMGLVRMVEDHVDIDALLDIAGTATVPLPAAQLAPQPATAHPRIRLGVAKDIAFGHCYSECVLKHPTHLALPLFPLTS